MRSVVRSGPPVSSVPMRGKWARGIVPRNFYWIIKDRLAVCERPGGFGENHRRVRRQEEIIWLRENGFDVVVSLLASEHNLHNYDELEVSWTQLPFSGAEDGAQRLVEVFGGFDSLLDQGKRVVLHRDELGEVVCGLVAAYLLWKELVPTGPRAVAIAEQLLERQLGSAGRQIVELVAGARPAGSAEAAG